MVGRRLAASTPLLALPAYGIGPSGLVLDPQFSFHNSHPGVIYRLTVQTLPDGLETQITPPDTTQTALSCRVWRAV